ncbi:MAG: hypothetical protein OQJ89_08150 [Kangiellaceae bacterium]|nr:hypothetical protein [Kangiellaceae bacterium]MCW8997282.1 hypothetical protein [Kangiellaceae bacterium]MCW9016919.1 hypothetical protein [Kangiellaceae bacterium]
MFQLIHQLAFYVHVMAGSLAMVVFWLPMLAKKGSAKHVKYGRYFVNGMYAVSVSGLIMTILVLIDPVGIREPARNLSFEAATNLAHQNRLFAGFLLMLSILVFNSVRHSIMVLRVKSERILLRTPLHVGLFVLLGLVGLIMGYVGTIQGVVLFQIFAGLCIVNSIATIHYIFKAEVKKREWIIAHLGSILGAGIGAYTAFFVFGGSRLFSQLVSGSGQVLLWVLPGVVGTIASIYLAKKYRRQYRVA